MGPPQGQEGFLAPGAWRWGLFWKAWALTGVEDFFIGDCLNLGFSLTLPGSLGGVVSMSKIHTFNVIIKCAFLRKENKVFMNLGVKIACLTGLS